MSYLGVHLAITDDQLDELRTVNGNMLAERIDELHEQLRPGKFVMDTDKAWSLINQVLVGADPFADDLSFDNSPSGWVIGGQSELKAGGEDFLATYTPANAVPEVAAALHALSVDDFRSRFEQLVVNRKLSDRQMEAIGYATDWYSELEPFFWRAANADRNVLFVADL